MGTRQRGALPERRVILVPSGFEVEYGFAPPSWADTAPLDEAPAGVVEADMRIRHDPDGLLGGPAATVAQKVLFLNVDITSSCCKTGLMRAVKARPP